MKADPKEKKFIQARRHQMMSTLCRGLVRGTEGEDRRFLKEVASYHECLADQFLRMASRKPSRFPAPVFDRPLRRARDPVPYRGPYPGAPTPPARRFALPKEG